MLGQVLYLEAEAVNVRGTGIGCYFDDGVWYQNQTFQNLYHFTVGGAITDTRLQTLTLWASAAFLMALSYCAGATYIVAEVQRPLGVPLRPKAKAV